MKKYYIRSFIFCVFLKLTFIGHSQVQDAWVTSDLSFIGASVENAALVLDNNENVYAGVNTFDLPGGVGLVPTFWIWKFTSDGTKIFDLLESVSTVFDKRLVGMAVDNSGNIYCAVYESRILDPVTATLGGLFAVYKYNANGTVAWKRSYGDGEHNIPRAIALDPAGNVYLTGGCKESGLVQNNDLADYLTVKWNSNGDLQWARRYDGASPGEGFNIAQDITVDGSGNVYITGFSQRDGQIGYATIKYNTSGTELWVQRYTGTGSGDDRAMAIVRDISGFIYVTGSSEGSIATIKYNNDGALLWVQREGTVGGAGREVKVDAFGNVYVAGNTSQTEMAVVKYRFDGVKQWTATRANSSAHSIALDASGNVYASGTGNGDGLTIKYNSSGVSQWVKINDSPLATGRNSPIAVSPVDNVYVISFTSLNTDGNANPYHESYLIKYTQCTISMPLSIRVSTEPGLCGATVNWGATTTGDCSDIVYLATNDQEFTPGSFLNRGHYHLRAVSQSTGAEVPFTIYVDDEELPVITNCPESKTVNTDPGVCYATAANLNAGTATATDNCSVTVTGTRSDGLALTANYPVGETTITWRATDAQGNTVTCSQTITLIDNEPPVISNESASTYVLSPPNHTMRDVTINYTVTDNCAVTSTLSVTSNEPVNGTGDGDTDPDWIVVDNHHVKLRAERSAQGNGRIYTVTITATDPSGNTSTKTIEVRVSHDIRKPVSGKPFKVGTTVDFEGTFWDKPGSRHTAKWMLDNSTNVKATVTEPSGNQNGKVTGSYKFNSPGVYKLQMNTTDQNGITHYTTTNGDIEEIVVIYDPNGGYTYGGGWYASPAGALTADLTASGKASFGFAVNYKNATNPKGETQFEFKVGNFEFNALNFDYLVVSGAKAQFRGTGKITGGQSGIAFIMTVIDGEFDGTGVDKIRMKVYNRNTNAVIYDNQPGASDADDPVTPVGNNSEIFIQGSSTPPITNKNEIISENTHVVGLNVLAYPNPSNSNFSIVVQADDKEQITMQIMDMYGRVIEARNVAANSVTRFGDHYKAGVYFVRIMQGEVRKEIKLVKF